MGDSSQFALDVNLLRAVKEHRMDLGCLVAVTQTQQS